MEMVTSQPDYIAEKGTKRPAWLTSSSAAFCVLVLLPSLIVLIYTVFIASPRFEARAEFMVRGLEQEAPPIGGIAELVAGAASSNGSTREALAVRDYLLSLDAIERLGTKDIDVEELLYGEKADWFNTLRYSGRQAETTRDYFGEMVSVDYDAAEGIARLSVKAYEADAAQELAKALIVLGEEQVNTYNARALAAGEELASEQLEEAQSELISVQAQLTDYRDLAGDIDPAATGQAVQKEIEALEARLILERSELGTMRRYLAGGSPLVVAAQSRVETLQNAVGQMRANLTGDSDALNRRLSEFEQLSLQREFAATRLKSARAQLQEARTQAAKQQLFLVEIVRPNLPEKPVGPTPIKTFLTVLFGLCLAFAIGKLLLAGIREHRAD